MNRGLLFDLDGVLVDTAKYHYLAWKALADELKIPFTLEDNERLKGVSRIRSFEIILELGQRVMSEVEAEVYCTKKNKNYLELIKALTPEDCLPGVTAFLADAKAKGYGIALGSASKNAKGILDSIGLTKYFDVLVDGTKVSKAKPDPEVFVKGAEGLGLPSNQCLVFEDAVAGIEAAHGAGMKAVGVGSNDNLPEGDIHIDTFEGITADELWQKLYGGR